MNCNLKENEFFFEFTQFTVYCVLESRWFVRPKHVL